MTIQLHSTGFGWLVANGARYDHDIIITADAHILPRPKHLSKKYGGWHTVLGAEEIAQVIESQPEILLVGRGQFNLLPIPDATRALLAALGIALEMVSTPRALSRFAELRAEGKRVAAVLHVTC